MAQTQNTSLQMVQTQISGNCAAFYTSDSLLSLSLVGVEGTILQSLWLESWIQILIRSQKAREARIKKTDWQIVQENPNMKLVSDSTGNGYGEQNNQGIKSLYSHTVPVRAETFLFFYTEASTKVTHYLLYFRRLVTWKSFNRGKLNIRAKIPVISFQWCVPEHNRERVPQLQLRGTTGQQIQLRLLCVEEVIHLISIISYCQPTFYFFWCLSWIELVSSSTLCITCNYSHSLWSCWFVLYGPL